MWADDGAHMPRAAHSGINRLCAKARPKTERHGPLSVTKGAPRSGARRGQQVPERYHRPGPYLPGKRSGEAIATRCPRTIAAQSPHPNELKKPTGGNQRTDTESALVVARSLLSPRASRLYRMP